MFIKIVIELFCFYVMGYDSEIGWYIYYREYIKDVIVK